MERLLNIYSLIKLYIPIQVIILFLYYYDVVNGRTTALIILYQTDSLLIHVNLAAKDETVSCPGYYYCSGLSRPILKNLEFLGFFKPKQTKKVRFLGFLGQNFYFFMSNSLNLFELI